MKIMPRFALLCSLSLLISSVTFAYSPKWMKEVVAKENCIDSLGAVVGSERSCRSWTRKETAKPFYDPSNSRILVGGSDNFLHVVRPKDGQVVRRIELKGNLLSAPVLSMEDGLVIFATDEGVSYGLKQSDLSVAWETKVDSGVLQAATLISGSALILTKLGTLYSLDPKNGEIKWFKKRELPNRIALWNRSSPIMIESDVGATQKTIIAIGNADGRLEFLDVDNGETIEDMQLGANREPFADVATTPVANDRLLFAASFNKGLVAINKKSRVRKWEIKEKGITQLATASGVVVASGAKFVLGANAETGKILWTYKFSKGSPSEMEIKNGKVFVSSDIDGLYVLDLFMGAPLQVLGSGLGFTGGVEFVDDNLLTMSSSGSLFMFDQGDRVVSARSLHVK